MVPSVLSRIGVAQCLLVWLAFMLGGCDPSVSASPRLKLGAENLIVATYGDSTQSAHGTPHSSTREGWTITNHGVSGSTSQQLYEGKDGLNKPWGQEMAESPAHVVILNHGLNDGNLSARQYRQSLKRFIDVAHRSGKVFILEEPNEADQHGEFDVPKFKRRVEEMRAVARETGVYLCAQPRVPLQDGVHPTPEGYAVKAERLAKCIADVRSTIQVPVAASPE